MPKRSLKTRPCNFARNLKQIRKSANITQKDVADKIGVNRTTYTKWETGVTEPPFSCILDMIDLFNESGDIKIDFNMLFGEPDNQT